ncbi:MAG: GreA/GreB family elongation factor [Verrucomicrobiales bacterium]|nr:GreA/GreB family elongation factor [Verrucomicrobiales bacterium]
MSSEIHPDVERLLAAGKITATAALKLSQLVPGTYVSSKSWGAGQVAAWDTLADKMTVDFEGKAGHELKLDFAAKTLEPVPETHFLARRFADKPGLVEFAEKDVAGFVRLVLQSCGGRVSLDNFEDMVKGKVLPEARFKSWWEAAKKTLRTKPQFIVPSKRNLPLELRGEDISPMDALLQDFHNARELKAKIKAIEAILRESHIFDNPHDTLHPVSRQAEESALQHLKLKPAEAFEMLLMRDDLLEKVESLRAHAELTVGQALQQVHDRLHEFIGSLTPTKQHRVFDALPDALGENWQDRALALINRLSQRSLGELAKVFTKREQVQRMAAFFKSGISHRSLSSDALAWICRERRGLTKDVFSWELAPALMSAIERDHLDDDKKSNRVLDVLMEDKELLADLLSEAEPTRVNNFARQVLLSPAFDELTKRSLMARLIKVVPEVEELIHEHREDNNASHDRLAVSWPSLVAMKKAYDHLVTVEIPKNREDISIARSYGDLRENFEYKSAKEYQRVLSRRQREMARDLERAEGSDFSDAPADRAVAGTVVSLKCADGSAETYTILGAWDSDPARHVISYLTEIAKALLGKTVGESAELPGEEGGDVRMVEIIGIQRWRDTPAGQAASVSPPESVEPSTTPSIDSTLDLVVNDDDPDDLP